MPVLQETTTLSCAQDARLSLLQNRLNFRQNTYPSGWTTRALPPTCATKKLPRVLRIYPFRFATFYEAAITSISTRASFGSRATCTVERAGGAWLKYFP